MRLRRFALLIGVNDGGPARAKLRYATSDARSVARVLENLGGVSPADLVFVDAPTRAAALEGFQRVDALMRAAATPGVRRELLVYYSGHSDEEGLLLGTERVSYDELRARIKGLPAELRVAILDSCASGAFTRGKGGVRRPPFLLDASADMRGHAFLTSSAANEVAQESDRIAASFFTYFLVSGLRGAADVNGDRRVTLQEAYQFASAETLARTERTKGGPQHAAYEFDLAGTGDMVVTDVRTTQASLVLAPDLAGRISVREAGGGLVAELRKTAGHPIELGVEAGSYVVSMDNGGGVLFEAQATLAQGERADLSKLSFHPGKPVEIAVARGDAPPEGEGAGADAAVTAVGAPPHTRMPTKLGIVPRDGDERIDVSGFSFGFVGDRVGALRGFQLGLGWTEAGSGLRGLQMAVGATYARGDSRGLQLSGAVTATEGRFSGAQIAGLGALAIGEARGLQMAGIAAYARGPASGLQMAGVTAVAEQARGVQLAGVVARADDVQGLQLSPVNVARDQAGMQLGVVNVVDEGAGLRFGVVNVARKTRGFQLGVVNVAQEDDGESFALINVIGNGIHDVAVTASDVFLTNLSFKLGGRHLYTSLGAGYQPGDAAAPAGSLTISRGEARWGSSVGIGWRLGVPAGRLEALEIEANGTNVWRAGSATGGAGWSAGGTPAMVNALRVTGVVRLVPHLSLLAGVAWNVMVAEEGHDLDLALGPQTVIHDGRTTVRMYPGFVAGLQL
ncbi:MAG TPA: caspase family protein [Polyangia bacterium]|nr:caspase family protein [Polyangia bacterium]